MKASALLAIIVLGMAAPARPDDSYPQSLRTVQFTYEAEIQDISELAEKACIWLPLPITSDVQIVKNSTFTSTHPYEVVTDDKYGNRFLLMELNPEAIQNLETNPAISMTLTVTRKSVPALKTRFAILRENQTNMELYLADSTFLTSGGRVKSEAQKVSANAATPLDKARSIYNHIVSTVKYDQTGQGSGKGNSQFACTVRAGNCTDFHSLFIGETRSLNIPARFVMGFPLPQDRKKGEIAGYHCWAEFFIDDQGWLPVDASEAHRNPDMKEAFFGGLDENRIEFTTGRDITLPKMTAGPVNFSIYPYAEVDGKPHTSIHQRFSFKDIE